jgi:outer membrane protein assembly factor BamB
VKRRAPLALWALLCALLWALLAGCGQSTTAPPDPAPVAKPTPLPAAAVFELTLTPPPKPKPKQVWRHKVEVTVLDGDTRLRLAGARVRIGRHADFADVRGVALVPFPSRAGVVHVAAPGYIPRTIRVSFRNSPRAAVRVYRPSAQWPMYGVDAARTQAHSEIRLRPPFRVVWSRGLGSLLEFPAVVSHGVAYIGNAKGTVFALSMDDGREIWRRATRYGKMAASPAIWGDQLVVHGMDGNVSLRRLTDGRLLARVSVGSPIESSPIVRDGIDYFGSWDGVVTALDLRTRRAVWTYRSGCKITSSAAIAGPTLFIGDYCGRLLALDRATGRLRWSGSVNGRIYGTPAVAAGRVFVGSSSGGSMNAFSTAGARLWNRYFGSYVYSSPAVWQGRVFFGTYGGSFYGLSAASGSTMWSVATGGPVSGAAAVVAGVAYAGSFAHRIVGVDALEGRVVLDFPHGAYVPVSGAGNRLLLHGWSRLYAVAKR